MKPIGSLFTGSEFLPTSHGLANLKRVTTVYPHQGTLLTPSGSNSLPTLRRSSKEFQFSSLPTTELSDEMQMPKCEYSVRRDSPNGPTLTFANVGETVRVWRSRAFLVLFVFNQKNGELLQVYHVWECNPPDMGMLVKKCFVTDGDGEDHAVIDYDGLVSSSSA